MSKESSSCNTSRFGVIPSHRSREWLSRGVRSDKIWSDYGSPLSDYQEFFSCVLQGKRIEDLISGIQEPVVIDLMSPTWTLYDMFSKNKLAEKKPLGVAISFEDLRSDESKSSHDALNIHLVAGNLLNSSTWARLKDNLSGRKANLIMEKAKAGLGEIPNDPKLYAILFQRMWSMLDESGTMLLETYPAEMVWPLDGRRISYSRFVEYLNSQGAEGRYDNKANALYVRKTPNSPEKLSFIPEVLIPIS